MAKRIRVVVLFQIVVLSCLVVCLMSFLMPKPRRPSRPQKLSLSGKRVIVIGNASIEGLGREIDAFDVIIRVNPLEKRPANDVGARTDILHLNDNISSSRLRHVPQVDHIWTRNALQTSRQRPDLNTSLLQYDFNKLRARHPEFGERCGSNELRRLQLTSGMLVVVQALETVKVVYCAGLSAYTRKSHEMRKGSEEFHARNLKNYHCIDQEKLLMKRLIGEGRLIPIDNVVI